MKMKELPRTERPYEKLEEFGAQHLTTAELLAIIIKTGTKNRTAIEIAQELLKEDTKEKGIRFLNDFSIPELMKKEGIGRVKAIVLKAVCELANRSSRPSIMIRRAISSPEEIYEMVGPELQDEKREVIKTVLLDCHNRVISVVQNAIGGMNTSMIEVKDIYREPIKLGANRVILIHNHPSGDLDPSEDDLVCTEKMKNAGMLFGIHLLDHIIMGENGFVSLKRMGIL